MDAPRQADRKWFGNLVAKGQPSQACFTEVEQALHGGGTTTSVLTLQIVRLKASLYMYPSREIQWLPLKAFLPELIAAFCQILFFLRGWGSGVLIGTDTHTLAHTLLP